MPTEATRKRIAETEQQIATLRAELDELAKRPPDDNTSARKRILEAALVAENMRLEALLLLGQTEDMRAGILPPTPP